MYILTEVLSFLHMINRFGIAAGWIIFDAMLAAIILFRLKSKGRSMKFCVPYREAAVIIRRYPVHILIGMVTFALALAIIPYDADSMIYHMPRVAHWAQNKSVSHFATNEIRQVSSPILSSFINLHIYVMFGKGNMLFNMLQWFCYVANAWIVMQLAYKIGCTETWAKIASLLFMSMPIAVAEALSTQVDLFSTLWLLIFTYFILDFVTAKEHIGCDKHAISNCVMLGACVAYGFLAKPSVSIGMFAMAVGLLAICIKRRNPIVPLLKLIAIAVPLMVLIISPEIIRNIITFNAVQPEVVSGGILIGTLQPAYMAVNFLKNFAANLPNIYIYESKRIIYMLVTAIAAILNVELDHPSISWMGLPYEVNEARGLYIATTVNAVVLISAITALIWCIYRNINHKQKSAVATYFSFGIFCLFCTVVRWQPWVSRFMASYLALLCPAVARQFQDMHENSKFRFIRDSVLPILSFCCAVDLFAMAEYHAAVVICERDVAVNEHFLADTAAEGARFTKGWWIKQSSLGVEKAEEYQEVEDLIRNSGIDKIGLEFTWDVREYLIWYMGNGDMEIKHINVQNETMKYEDKQLNKQFMPDCILSTRTSSDKLEFGGREYALVEESRDNQYIWQYVLKR